MRILSTMYRLVLHICLNVQRMHKASDNVRLLASEGYVMGSSAVSRTASSSPGPVGARSHGLLPQELCIAMSNPDHQV
jgi:hypothetical protein